jgi:hypothetical protein
MGLIRSGRIDLSAVWGSTHSEFMGAEELNRLVYDFASLARRYAIKSQVALMDDVPGQPFSVPSVLAGSGLRYLLIGANQFVGGGTSLSPGNVPFYWEGPDGQRILTWVSQSPRGGYTEGITDFFLDPFTTDPYTQVSAWKIFNPKIAPKSPLETMQAGMDILLKRFGDAGYRYDAALVMHAHDFLHPSTVGNLERAVRLWNGAHRTPELRIATASEFFHYMEEKYGATIPVVRGEFSGLWSEAKTSSPQISALARKAHDDVPAAETLWSVLSTCQKAPFPTGDLYTLYQLLFNYDEHSGAGNVGWPGLNEKSLLDQQNRQYAGFMQQASTTASYLLDSGAAIAGARNESLNPRPSTPIRTWPLTVWNPLSWERTDVVKIAAPEKGTHIVAIRDARNHRNVPFDRDPDGDVVFLAQNVPSVGNATFEIDAAEGPGAPTLVASKNSLSTQSSRFRISLGRDGSIRSIRDLRQNRELVNSHGAVPFNHLLRSEGDQPVPVPEPFQPEITLERGHVVTDLVVTRTGAGFPRTRIRLYDGLNRVEIRDEIDADRLPFVAARTSFDSYYFCFPFALDPATLEVRPEEQYGFLTLPGDYLPGARRDAVTSQHVIALSDANATMLLAHRQAFYFVFPGYVRTEKSTDTNTFPAMFTGRWPLSEATLYSKAFRHSSQGDMRSLGITTFRSVEPGLGNQYNFDYAIGSEQGAFDPVTAMRFGLSFDVPLVSTYVPFAHAASRSWVAVDQPNVRIDTVKEAEIRDSAAITPTNLENSSPKRQFTIRLQEIAGKNTRAAITLPGLIRSAVVVNLTEERELGELPATIPLVVSLTPYQTLTVRFELEEKSKPQK